MAFTGFDRGALDCLRLLPEWDADTYAEHKGMLKDGLVEPGAGLIEAVAEGLGRPLTVVRRSSVSPLHRDLRFATEGASRYKDYLMLTTWEGADKRTAPILWMRIEARRIGFASGQSFDPKARARWREAVGGDAGKVLARAIEKVESSAKGTADVAGESLKKVPAPWPADHPRGHLLRMNGFQIRFMEPLPASVTKPAFAAWCTTRLKRLLPVHDWLVEHVSAATSKPSKAKRKSR